MAFLFPRHRLKKILAGALFLLIVSCGSRDVTPVKPSADALRPLPPSSESAVPLAAQRSARGDDSNPLIALTWFLPSATYSPLFILYPSGVLIHGEMSGTTGRYTRVQLGQNDVRSITATVDAAALAPCNGQVYSESTSLFASYCLAVRTEGGPYIRVRTASLDGIPNADSTDESVRRLRAALSYLRDYRAQGGEEWTPGEIEVQFEPAVPSPGMKEWWPEGWPRCSDGSGATRSKNDRCIIILADGRRDAAIKLLRNPEHRFVRFGRQGFLIQVRYPFPGETVVTEEFDSTEWVTAGGAT